MDNMQRQSGKAAAVDEARLEALMRRQHGLVSRSQALDAGMTRHRILHRVNTGRWRRAGRGVYQLSAVPITPQSRLLAACLGNDGLASHRSAAALHGIDGFKPATPEVVVAFPQGRSIPGVIVHRSTQMHLARRAEIDGVPCTGLARTVLDLAAVVSREALERAIDSVVRDRRLRYRDLHDVLAAHERRGRGGVAQLRTALDARCGDEIVPLSQWSRSVGELLVGAGLGRPTMEQRVYDDSGKFVAQVDLAYPSRRLAIELDSIRWHHNSESFVNDRRRRNRLQAIGWDVLNFTWQDYSEQPAELCAVVAKAFATARSG